MYISVRDKIQLVVLLYIYLFYNYLKLLYIVLTVPTKFFLGIKYYHYYLTFNVCNSSSSFEKFVLCTLYICLCVVYFYILCDICTFVH